MVRIFIHGIDRDQGARNRRRISPSRSMWVSRTWPARRKIGPSPPSSAFFARYPSPISSALVSINSVNEYSHHSAAIPELPQVGGNRRVEFRRFGLLL